MWSAVEFSSVPVLDEAQGSRTSRRTFGGGRRKCVSLVVLPMVQCVVRVKAMEELRCVRRYTVHLEVGNAEAGTQSEFKGE